MSEPLRYKAFISYSHRDTAAVKWLHRRLETYRIPRSLRSTGVPERLSPVYRDRDEFAAAARLSDSIEAALGGSAALIVACSPAAVASRWVNDEIRFFRSRFPERPVFAFIVDGDPLADPRRSQASACFPPALILQDVDDPDGPVVEPAAPDARKHADGRDTAFLKLAAGLLGVPFDTLRQRELRRQQQRWALFGAVSLVLSGVFAVLAWQATVARDAARVAQARAELEAQTARQTSDFMVSLFEVSDPSESRGNSITAREVLDRGVNRIEHAEFARPLIKARLLGTMGKVYSYLGLYPRAEELLARSDRFVEVADPGSEEAAQRFDLLWELGELQLRRGDYPSARAALAKIGTPDTRLPDYARREAKRRNLLGDLDFYEGKDAPAREHYQAALAALSQGGVDDAIQRARALQGSAAILSFSGEAEAAIPGLEEAFDLLLKHHGEDHRYTLSVLDQLGAALYQAGRSRDAEQRWIRALAIGERIYGPTHPEVGTFLNNLALVKLEDCRFADAEPLLLRSVAIDRAAREQNFDDLTYSLNSLALARLGRGATTEAETALREGLQIAVEHRHRMSGPIASNLADLLCATGRGADGLDRAAQAVAASVAEYGASHWRTRQAEITRAFCAASAASTDLDAALEAITLRWGESNLYRQRALAQITAIARRTGDASRSTTLAHGLVPGCQLLP
jgi:tetratricopeptide (TPR) repeat protein